MKKTTISPDVETEQKIREMLKSKGKVPYDSEVGLSIPSLTDAEYNTQYRAYDKSHCMD